MASCIDLANGCRSRHCHWLGLSILLFSTDVLAFSFVSSGSSTRPFSSASFDHKSDRRLFNASLEACFRVLCRSIRKLNICSCSCKSSLSSLLTYLAIASIGSKAWSEMIQAASMASSSLVLFLHSLVLGAVTAAPPPTGPLGVLSPHHLLMPYADWRFSHATSKGGALPPTDRIVVADG